MLWLRKMNTTERKTFVSAFGGWAIDAFDFMIFTFVISTLMNLWQISKAEAGLLGTVTLVFSAIGGWIAGILADKYGRVRILQYTILWFSICTILVGFTQNFTQLFILRAIQGLGFGGEWAVGSVLIGEIVRSENRGKVVGSVQSGWAIGWGCAAIVYTLIFTLIPPQYAWRILFWLGVLPAFLVLYIRKHVTEPEVFTKTKQIEKNKNVSFLDIFSKGLIKTTVLSAILCTAVQGGYYAITTWLPTYLEMEKGLSVLNTGKYLGVIIFGSFIGYISGAYLTDKLGRRGNLLLFSVISCISVYVYTQLSLSNNMMLILGFPLGFAASGIFSGLGPYLTELFPNELRANGQGFSYNFGRGIGALFPALVGYLAEQHGLAWAIGIFAGCAYFIVIIATFLLPETKGNELKSYTE